MECKSCSCMCTTKRIEAGLGVRCRTQAASPVLEHQQLIGCSHRRPTQVPRCLSFGLGLGGSGLGVAQGGSCCGPGVSPVQKGDPLRGSTLRATHCLATVSSRGSCQLTNRICQAGDSLGRRVHRMQALTRQLEEISAAVVQLLRSSRRRRDHMGFVDRSWGCCWCCRRRLAATAKQVCSTESDSISLAACWLLTRADRGSPGVSQRAIARGPADLLPTVFFQHSTASLHSLAHVISSHSCGRDAGCGAFSADGSSHILIGC